MMKEGRDKSERGTDVSPPSSPVSKRQGPFRSTVSAQMRCKIFLKQSHAQWKSLGNARLKLYHILPDDIKQLVVENDRKTLISTIVLTDGVERVGKVGVAVELSDRGNRTGIVYMLQMRSEESAGGLFSQLLEEAIGLQRLHRWAEAWPEFTQRHTKSRRVIAIIISWFSRLTGYFCFLQFA